MHPGGRSILDSVQDALELDNGLLAHSREILRTYGNMSSATVMFVLARMLAASQPDQRGCAVAFGPGLSAEAMTFRVAGRA